MTLLDIHYYFVLTHSYFFKIQKMSSRLHTVYGVDEGNSVLIKPGDSGLVEDLIIAAEEIQEKGCSSLGIKGDSSELINDEDDIITADDLMAVDDVDFERIDTGQQIMSVDTTSGVFDVVDFERIATGPQVMSVDADSGVLDTVDFERIDTGKKMMLLLDND